MERLTDDEIIKLLQFTLDRFVGGAPDENVLKNCLFDFKRDLAIDRRRDSAGVNRYIQRKGSTTNRRWKGLV